MRFASVPSMTVALALAIGCDQCSRSKRERTPNTFRRNSIARNCNEKNNNNNNSKTAHYEPDRAFGWGTWSHSKKVYLIRWLVMEMVHIGRELHGRRTECFV